jgi:hypothetical protein
MKRVASLAGALLAALLASAGCTRLVVAPSPRGVAAIAVLPVDNRTGSELFVDAPPLLLGLLRDAPAPPRLTVPDLLAENARRRLAEQGFSVVPAAVVRDALAGRTTASAADAVRALREAGVTAPALYLTLWRWDPDAASRPTFVDVKLDMVLLAARDAPPLWQARLPAQPVEGDGTGTISFAYPAVARRVVDDMLAALRPLPP